MEGKEFLNELRDTEFSAKLRGYDPKEVDEMFDRAREEIYSLHKLLRIANEKARMAEDELASELATVSIERKKIEELSRETEANASQIVKEAETKANELFVASELEVEEVIESKRLEVLEEVKVAEEMKQEIRNSIELAEIQIAAHRDRLLISLRDLQELTETLTLLPSDSSDLSDKANENFDLSEKSVINSEKIDKSYLKQKFSEIPETTTENNVVSDIENSAKTKVLKVIDGLKDSDVAVSKSADATGEL